MTAGCTSAPSSCAGASDRQTPHRQRAEGQVGGNTGPTQVSLPMRPTVMAWRSCVFAHTLVLGWGIALAAPAAWAKEGACFGGAPEVVARNQPMAGELRVQGRKLFWTSGGRIRSLDLAGGKGGDGRRRRDHSGAGRRRPASPPLPATSCGCWIAGGGKPVCWSTVGGIWRSRWRSLPLASTAASSTSGARHPTIALKKQPGSSACRLTALARPSGSRWNPMARRRSWSRAATWSGVTSSRTGLSSTDAGWARARTHAATSAGLWRGGRWPPRRRPQIGRPPSTS